MSSVRAKLNDPNLQKEVKEKAAAGWSWLSSTATSLWSAAKETASSLAAELGEEGVTKPATQTQTGTLAATQVGTPRVGEEEKPAPVEKMRTPVEERKEEEDWMEAELKKARWARGGRVRGRENLNLMEKKKEETTVTSSGLKISNEGSSRRRHHSHHHSHHRCRCGRRGEW